MIKILVTPLCSVLGILLLVSLSFAQTFNATVVGKVTDANGASVAGASVTITQTATNRAQSAVTNDEGEFVLPQLSPGSYTLRVEANNFKVCEFK